MSRNEKSCQKAAVQGCDISLISNPVYDINTFPYTWFYDLPLLAHGKGETRYTKRIDYIKAICSFDIETTAIDDLKQSICYIWQFAINEMVVIGRNLQEFKLFLDKLMKYSDSRTRLLIYIHNLSYEFHHLREILDFENVFSTARRKPIKANYRQVEFRCSYILTNMGLDAFLKKMRVENLKTTMDYRRKRYPWSKINAKDTQYCLHDVIGLNQAIKKLLDQEGDTLYTIPLTSTGYTRRDVKSVMWKYSRSKKFQESVPDFNIFYELWEAFRGGNTHANRFYAERILDYKKLGKIKSCDKVSCYHDAILNRPFPWKFTPSDIPVEFAMKHGLAVLTRVILRGVKMREKWDGAPYIPLSKCRHAINYVLDNGRILTADRLILTVSDVDLKIILKQYSFDKEPFYFDTYVSEYKPLPEALKNVVRYYYRKKTELKDVEDKIDELNKFKGRFNAIYGLMVQNPCKEPIEYSSEFEELFELDTSKPLQEIYEKNKKKQFLLYQWGVWVTSWSRYELQHAIDLVQNTENAAFLYCDTDSVKYFGDVDFTNYNTNKIDQSLKSAAFASDTHGKTHYIGVFEPEQEMLYFITHGAKKYAYVGAEDHELHLTCAGVAKKGKGNPKLPSYKKSGAEELWCIDYFQDGFVFEESAGVEAKYNDRPEIRKYIVNGKQLYIYSNIYLSDSTYTVKKSKDYRSLLDIINYFN